MRARVSVAALAATLLSGLASAAGAQGAAGTPAGAYGRWRVGIAPQVVLPQSGLQAVPFELDVEASLDPGYGVGALLAREGGRVPVALHVSWSSHRHAPETQAGQLSGRTQLFRAALAVRTGAMMGGRLVAELGGGVMHARSETVIRRAGSQIGLAGVGAGVNVTETAPMGSAAVVWRLVRRPGAELALRVAADYAATDRKGTLVVPISIHLAR
jgi:hypothetical protein